MSPPTNFVEFTTGSAETTISLFINNGQRYTVHPQLETPSGSAVPLAAVKLELSFTIREWKTALYCLNNHMDTNKQN